MLFLFVILRCVATNFSFFERIKKGCQIDECLSMYKVNTMPHGKCFVRYIPTCFCIRNLTRPLPSLVWFLIRQQLARKYRMPALSMKYSKSGSVFNCISKRIKFFIEMTAMLGWIMEDFLSNTLMLPFVKSAAWAIYNTPKSRNLRTL